MLFGVFEHKHECTLVAKVSTDPVCQLGELYKALLPSFKVDQVSVNRKTKLTLPEDLDL